MYDLKPSEADREIQLVGFEALQEMAFLRAAADAYREVKKNFDDGHDESKLSRDRLTQMVADLHAEREREALQARKRASGVG
jgi:hypothetical protein